jgi:hypothetical protein
MGGVFGEGGESYSIAVVPIILMLSVPVTLMFPSITISKELMSYFDAGSIDYFDAVIKLRILPFSFVYCILIIA